MTRRGKENPNWRGGKSITSHGYVIVLVGTKHHLSDSKGYAYEHRVIAEQMLGRKLEKGEQVHHIDGDKTNNDPSNLTIIGGRAEHRALHRKKGSSLRLLDEPNPEIKCKCGCGIIFLRYDQIGRPRDYVSGHNPHPAKTQSEILGILERGGMHRNQIIRLCGKTKSSVGVALTRLKQKGLIWQIGRGVWALCQKQK